MMEVLSKISKSDIIRENDCQYVNLRNEQMVRASNQCPVCFTNRLIFPREFHHSDALNGLESFGPLLKTIKNPFTWKPATWTPYYKDKCRSRREMHHHSDSVFVNHSHRHSVFNLN